LLGSLAFWHAAVRGNQHSSLPLEDEQTSWFYNAYTLHTVSGTCSFIKS